MNRLNDIILSLQQEDIKEEKSQDKIKKKTFSNEEELNGWIFILKDKLSKREYKKVIKNIVSLGLIGKYKKTNFGYKIIIFYIIAQLKIIENKIFKYHLKENSNKEQKQQISHCLSYANNIQNELSSLIRQITDNNITQMNNYYNDIEKRNYKIEIVNDLLRCFFDYLYIMSLLHHKIGNFMEAITFLSLSLHLYKETKSLILSSHTLYKIEKCLILLSKIYILNEDYENALIFLNESIKICFKQILFQVHDLYLGVFVGDKKDLKVREKADLKILKDSKIKKIIYNIVIIFLYQGICNEHLSNIKNATAFYKQCEWFSRIFLEKNDKLIYEFFSRLKKNGIEVCNLIDLFNEKIEEYEVRHYFTNTENNSDITKIKYSLKKKKLFDTNKFKGLLKKLQGLKIKEIDTVNKFEKPKIIYRNASASSRDKTEANNKNLFMSNIRLLEAYLRRDFKDIVNDMNKITLFDFDDKTRGRVQKKLNKIYFEQNQRLIKRNNMKEKLNYHSFQGIKGYKKDNEIKSISGLSSINTPKTNELKKFESFSIFKRLNNKRTPNGSLSNYKLYKNISNHLKRIKNVKNNNFCNIRNKIFSRCLWNKRKIDSPENLSFSLIDSFKRGNLNIKSNSIEKSLERQRLNNFSWIKIHKSKIKEIQPENQKDKEFFNFSYLKKRNYIKKLCDRELLFQKEILKSKNTPKYSFKVFNKTLTQKKANDTYQKIESIVSDCKINNDWKDNLSDEEYKDYLINNKLEQAFINSLSLKALSKYKRNKRRMEKKAEEKENYEDNKTLYEKQFMSIDVNNKNTLLRLNEKLDGIYKKEQKRQNEIYSHKKKINRLIFKKLNRNKSGLILSKINFNSKY